MKVLVTGGCGFIGSNFIEFLFHKFGHIPSSGDLENYVVEKDKTELEILNVDNLTYASNQDFLNEISSLENYSFVKSDISNHLEMEEIFNRFSPDIIVNFAAESHVDRSIKSGDVFVKSNVMGVQVLLELSRKFGIEKFVQISTDEVYGSISEGSFSEESQLNPASPYSASKASADLIALSHYKTHGLPVIITRCTNNFGPNQHKEKLVPKVIHNCLNHKKIPIYGDGTNVRDWIYVKDHCEAISLIIEEGKFGEIYNVGGSNELSNLEIVEGIMNQIGVTKSLIEFVEDRPGHDWRYSVKDRKIKSLGWNPRVSFDKGLMYAINFVRSIK